jgi:branched-chain amino acid transport system substrate-binding protein
MNNKRFMPAILFLVLSLGFTACQPVNTASTNVPTGNGGPITIGTSLPLTGDFSDPGTAAQRGYQVWQALINQNGGLLGRQIQLKFVDNGSDPKKAAADYESLISTDKVDLVVGTFSSLLVIPTSAVAAQHNYAYIEPAGGAAEVFNRGLKNIFFAQPGQSVQNADPFALYILGLPADIRPKTFALVSLDDPFTKGVTARLKGLLTEGGLTLLYETTYPGNTTDFSSIATVISQLNPDMIIGGTQTDDSVAQIKAYQAANYQPRVAYFTNGPTIPDSFRKPLGTATEGIFSSISWFPDAHEYENDKFVAKYIEMFGGTPANIPEDSANAFTVGQVLQQAAESVKSIDNTALINELHHGTYRTVVGALSFDETGAPQGNYMLLQWQGNNFVIVGPGNRAEADPKAPPKPNW